MAVSAFDLFSIGIGPSSSHTVGPMRAARTFAARVVASGLIDAVASVRAELYGSLGATGLGHGTDRAVILGLEGERPEDVDVATIDRRIAGVRSSARVRLLGRHDIGFGNASLVFHRHRLLDAHPNGMRFAALDEAGDALLASSFYSVGGGFVVEDLGPPVVADRDVPFRFASARELLDACASSALPISGVMLANEVQLRSEPDVRAGLLAIWRVMRECVERGSRTSGTLPGGLQLPRRAPALRARLEGRADGQDPLDVIDRLNLWALAVSEENAAGARVVTAPTNGAAGIIPALLMHYVHHVPDADDAGVVRFLLTAAAIGSLYKENASISGAEVGCQGEVGVASSMAAAGLCEVLGGTPAQVENAAEIAMEHNLGLTCDPVGGLVQVPCIERNAMGAVKALNAARMAMHGTGEHVVSLDQVIRTMRQTGADMKVKYKETARGGLAVNVPEC